MAVMVKTLLLPENTGDAKPATVSVLAGAGLTVMAALPVMELLTVSVAVSVWWPAVSRAAANVCMPWSAVVNV